MKARYLVAAAVAALSIGSVANATVVVRAFDNGTQIFATSASQGNGGFVVQSGSDAIFSVTANVSGVPMQVDPTLSTNNFSLQVDGAFTAPRTLVIEFSQDGLKSATTSFKITNALDTNSAAGLTSSNVISYLGNGTLYDTSVATLSTLTCGAGTSCSSGAVLASSAHPGTYSETVRYTFNFGASTTVGQSVSGSNQITAGAVPEPATWGMMVLGFGVVGGALRTSRRKVIFA